MGNINSVPVFYMQQRRFYEPLKLFSMVFCISQLLIQIECTEFYIFEVNLILRFYFSFAVELKMSS